MARNSTSRPRRRSWLACALVLLLGVLTAPQASARSGRPETRPLTDLDGQPVVLRGLNTASSAKDAPGAMPWVGERDVRAERDRLGSNAVRLLIFWSRVEPRPGVYDKSYLDSVARRVAWYRESGMRVILDMHQDTWGPAVRGGSRNNGAPEWASHFDGRRAKANEQQWALTYLEPGVTRAFDHFWGKTGDHPELQEHYAAAWRHVALRFRDDPAVLGYDLMNEPWGGSIPWPFFEKRYLGPMYQRTIGAIREVDQRRWMLVEPQAFGVNQGLPSALPKLSDPREGRDRIAYAPHLYPPLLDLGQSYTGATRAITRGEVDAWFAANRHTARRLDAPLVLGEFGLDATKPGALDYVDDVRRHARETGASWLYWSNDPGSWGPRAEDGRWTPLADHLDSP